MWTFIKIGHNLGHKSSLIKFQKTDIINIFFDQSENKLEINNNNMP